jgi:hypothetical protein
MTEKLENLTKLFAQRKSKIQKLLREAANTPAQIASYQDVSEILAPRNETY